MTATASDTRDRFIAHGDDQIGPQVAAFRAIGRLPLQGAHQHVVHAVRRVFIAAKYPSRRGVQSSAVLAIDGVECLRILARPMLASPRCIPTSAKTVKER